MRIGIAGYGVVGQHMHEQLSEANDIVPWDPALGYTGEHDGHEGWDAAFVCVPTPAGPGVLEHVHEVFSWLRAPLAIIRSTVPVGTTDALQAQYGYGEVVFQPEYLGESVGHRLDWDFTVLGGRPEGTRRAWELWQRLVPASHRFYFGTAREAEMAKYMENCYYATKVTFVNDFADACSRHGLDFARVRELWLADPRVERDHTVALPEQAWYGGKCLPKDVKNFLEHVSHTPLMEAVDAVNDARRRVGEPAP